ncbi:RNA polymerase subunit sigma-70 [Brevundimonas sp. GW460-12-10-14-LB2]|nr:MULTISPECIES: sigma-70 family RNA polymerase sigma factor [Brevundimonas]ANC52395.1 RNA polymerase subunit sigma-70 [Brevundimonas sp. GW460-12-10-14-LB2]MRL67726.1 sigma-70 family RNA polymerase sigma factor [Brevundimonas sp. SPF441]
MLDRESQLKALMLNGLDGDAQAWRVLLSDLAAHLRPFFKRRLFNGESDAEDLVQETLIAIHAKRATWDRNQSFTAWAFTIARHKLIDHLRRQGRRLTEPLDDASVLLAEHTVEDGVMRRDLTRALSILPARQRALIHDVKVTGLSVAEAAERHGYSVAAAKVSIHRSFKALTARFAAGAAGSNDED